jgi:hypothetical protein
MPPRPRKPRAPFSEAIAVRLLDGLAAGRGLRRLCREPGMPTRATVLRWQARWPEFHRMAAAARLLGGLLDARGRPSGLTPEIADEIYLRLSHGEPLRTLCRHPHLPSRSTVHAWAQRHPDIARILDLARDNARWSEADRRVEALGGWDYFRPVTEAEAAEHPRQRRGRPRRLPTLDDESPTRRPPLPPHARARLKAGR